MSQQHLPIPVDRARLTVEAKLYAIERALKFDPDHVYRRQLVREYLDLTEPEGAPQ